MIIQLLLTIFNFNFVTSPSLQKCRPGITIGAVHVTVVPNQISDTVTNNLRQDQLGSLQVSLNQSTNGGKTVHVTVLLIWGCLFVFIRVGRSAGIKKFSCKFFILFDFHSFGCFLGFLTTLCFAFRFSFFDSGDCSSGCQLSVQSGVLFLYLKFLLLSHCFDFFFSNSSIPMIGLTKQVGLLQWEEFHGIS